MKKNTGQEQNKVATLKFTLASTPSNIPDLFSLIYNKENEITP